MRDLLVLVAAAAAVVGAGMWWKKRQGTAQAGSASMLRNFISGSPDTILNNALPTQPGYGWQYFTDGTAISPEGIYYQNGREIWRP